MRTWNQSLRKKIFPERKPNYNLCPTQLSPVVLVKDGERRFELFRFGLIPSWAKSVKDASKYSLINAKGEEIGAVSGSASSTRQRRKGFCKILQYIPFSLVAV